MIPEELKEIIIMIAKKYWKKGISTLAFFFIASFAYSSCSEINEKLGLEDDHPIEEAIEDFIKYKTGIEIDLSPED